MTRSRGRASGMRPLLDVIEVQRFGCEMAGSALYADVLDAVASDVVDGGPCGDLLAPFVEAPFSDAVLLRLLAGVHLLVLDGSEPVLASHYPSVGGAPGEAVGLAFLEAVARHRDRLARSLLQGVQTNEAGRSVALLGGFLELARTGRPLRILEVGASAGLNLRFDRYRYEQGSDAFGPAGSRVRFVDPWVGPSPALGAVVDVASRRGCDLDPIDATTEGGRLRLRSLIWPDQPDRRARLDAAIDVAGELSVTIDRADAVAWLGAQLAGTVPGQLTVVVHSIVLQYLPPSARTAFLAVIDEAGRRADHDAPLAWLRMEPGGDRAETRLNVWPSGTTDLLATSGFHGPPVAWVADRHQAGP